MGVLRVRGLDHVVLRVADLERSIRFYTNVLGCQVERQLESLGLHQLRAGAHLIDLVEVNGPLGRLGGGPPGEGSRNLDHFALQVEAFDPDELRSHLEANGVEAGEVDQRYGAEGMGPSMYIRDPDGNVIELKGPPAPQDRDAT